MTAAQPSRQSVRETGTWLKQTMEIYGHKHKQAKPKKLAKKWNKEAKTDINKQTNKQWKHKQAN